MTDASREQTYEEARPAWLRGDGGPEVPSWALIEVATRESSALVLAVLAAIGFGPPLVVIPPAIVASIRAIVTNRRRPRDRARAVGFGKALAALVLSVGVLLARFPDWAPLIAGLR